MIDHNIGEKIAVLQLIHHKRFSPEWIEFHHPRLTRMYLSAVHAYNLKTAGYAPGMSVEDLERDIFSWMQ